MLGSYTTGWVTKIARVEPLSKPAIYRSEQFASLLWLALVAPEPRKARSNAEFPGFCLLLTRAIGAATSDNGTNPTRSPNVRFRG